MTTFSRLLCVWLFFGCANAALADGGSAPSGWPTEPGDPEPLTYPSGAAHFDVYMAEGRPAARTCLSPGGDILFNVRKRGNSGESDEFVLKLRECREGIGDIEPHFQASTANFKILEGALKDEHKVRREQNQFLLERVTKLESKTDSPATAKDVSNLLNQVNALEEQVKELKRRISELENKKIN